jgi:very-short-patch-repair endonuclease
MTLIYNKAEQKENRRRLRKEMTSAEGILWAHIRNNKLGYKFRRQYGIGKYIADFYCPKLRLVIEVDGGGHYEPDKIESDKLRTEYLNSLGITVKRYTNLDIANNLSSVMDDLLKFCEGLGK